MTKRKSDSYSKHSSSHYDDANPSDSSSGEEETTNSIGDDRSASSQQQETETINDLSDHTKRLFDTVAQMMRNHLREATRVVSTTTKNNNKRQRRVQEEEDTLLAASAAATVSPTTTTKTTQRQQHSPTKTNHMDDESSSSSADNSDHYPSDLATLLEDLPNDSWKKQFLELVRYQQEHNSLSKLRKDNPKLRSWCSSQKRNQRMGILPSQRFELLETIGFSWK